jgi:hypothetical protein
LEVNRKLGFEPVTLIPGVFQTGGLQVLVMERDKCRWLLLPPPKEVIEYGQFRQVPDRV